MQEIFHGVFQWKARTVVVHFIRVLDRIADVIVHHLTYPAREENLELLINFIFRKLSPNLQRSASDR